MIEQAIIVHSTVVLWLQM